MSFSFEHTLWSIGKLSCFCNHDLSDVAMECRLDMLLQKNLHDDERDVLPEKVMLFTLEV
jgi:hypothetical protein